MTPEARELKLLLPRLEALAADYSDGAFMAAVAKLVAEKCIAHSPNTPRQALDKWTESVRSVITTTQRMKQSQ